MEDRVIRTLRAQAWSRAKGELRAILDTYWEQESEQKFREMDAAIKQFVETVEGEGWAE